MPRSPQYKIKRVQLDPRPYDPIELCAVLEQNDEPFWEVCGVQHVIQPEGHKLVIFYRRTT